MNSTHNKNNLSHLNGDGDVSWRQVVKTPAIVVPTLLAGVLLLLTISDQLVRDDFLHRALLMGEQVLPDYQSEPLNATQAAAQLFSFSHDDSDLLAQAKSYGNVPWWTHDQLTVNFWRPLAAVTHWLDYQLWPDSPWLMQLHSILWYMVLALVFGYWLRLLGVSRLVLWLVMLLYVLDASHIHAIGWIANRNIIIATTLGLLSLISLTRWSQQQNAIHGLLALGFYLLALLSAEAAISVFGLVLPFIVFLDKHSAPKRVAMMAAFVVVTLAWRLLYSSLGYGSKNSGFYLDPINNTTGFIQSLLANGPIMLYEQLIRVPSLSMLMPPALEFNQVIISLIVLSVACLIFIPLLIRNRLALFAMFAGVIALPPACATLVTGGRLMFFFGIGVCLLLAIWFAAIVERPDWVKNRKAYGVLAYIWSAVIAVAVIGGTGFVWYSKVTGAIGKQPQQFNVYTDVLDQVSADQTLVLINPPVVFEQMYLPLKAHYYGYELPKNIVMLVPGYTGFELLKANEQGLRLRNSSGFMIDPLVPWIDHSQSGINLAFLFRRVDSFFTAGTDFAEGQSVALQNAHIRIAGLTAKGDPKNLVATFSKPLNSNDYVFLYWDWNNDRYQRLDIDDLADAPLKVAGPFID